MPSSARVTIHEGPRRATKIYSETSTQKHTPLRVTSCDFVDSLLLESARCRLPVYFAPNSTAGGDT